MYLLRCPISKLRISKVIPSNSINLNSTMVCPLCRLSRITSNVFQTHRKQSTDTQLSLIRMQIKKRKKRNANHGEYSGLIQVAENSRNNITEKRAIIKKSSSSEILKNLVPTNLKKLHCAEGSGSATSSNETSDALRTNLLNGDNSSPKINATPLSSQTVKPAICSSSTKGVINSTVDKAVTKIVKKITEKANLQPLKPNLVQTSTKNSRGTISAQLDSVAIVDDFALDYSYNLENINTSGLKPLNRGLDWKRPVILPILDLDIGEVDEMYTKAKSEKKEVTENKSFSLPLSKKILKEQKQDKVFKIKHDELEKLGKDMYLNSSLSSFLDVCINLDMLNVAHSTLLHCKFKGNQDNNASKVTDVRLFNIVLAGHAQKGNWSKLKELIAVLRNEQIKPNLQTYVACLECISRLPVQEKRIIRLVLQDAEKHDLDIAKIDQECIYVNDQRKRVIEMVRLVNPDFQPAPRENLRHYSCNLLSRLNEEHPKDRFYDPLGGAVTYEQLLENSRCQMETEVSNKVHVNSIETLSKETDENLENTMSILRDCEKNWREVLLHAYEENLRLIKRQQGSNYGRIVTLHPFLVAIKPELIVEIMLEEIRYLAESSETFSLSMSMLHHRIGKKVMQSYLIAKKQKQGIVNKIESLYQKYCEYYVNPKLTSQYTPREYWQKLTNENMEGPTIDVDEKTWPSHILVGIGKFIYDIIIQETKIFTNILKSDGTSGWQIPAFYSVYRVSGVKTKEEIKPHPVVVDLYQNKMKEKLTFEGTIVPSLVPPLPWTSIKSGGYLLSSEKIIRLPDAACHQKIKLAQTPKQQLFPLYDSLNQLGECPWKINKPILDIILEIFNNKGDEGLDIPPPSSECPPFPPMNMDMSKEERVKAYKERKALKNKRTEMHSLRCDSLYKLSIANHFRDKIFWFPYNIDFRGRVYPCPPHFNHLGGDVVRSILLFAKGEPLGENGLDWLKIHLINLTGLKKQEDIKTRLEYANESLDEIMDSADNPLNGRRWWAKSDERWQTLACCKEIAIAIRSPDPKKHVCYFPIHQDGSCNGLQHYAALGRDEHGAKQVNLYPMAKPQDVYTGVANLVEQERAKDAQNGNEIAKVLEGHIKRKVIKQTVMTTVYGVTRYGAREQIDKQLKDLPDFPQDEAWAASLYLTQKTFKSLQQMFTATKEIQDWFTEIAKLVSKVCGQPLEWVTPLGLPIVQPYHKPVKSVMSLGMGNKRQKGKHFKMDMFLRPNVMKQRNAFPPNFVHSLDSAHMMLTSLFCQREGITFVSVHDCYWTHPSKNVDIMNMICREQFVALHSEPILENLSKYLSEMYSYSESEFDNDGSVNDLAKRTLNKILLRVPATGECSYVSSDLDIIVRLNLHQIRRIARKL